MDEFMIELAKSAVWNRFAPFPDKYRTTSRPGEPHTQDEYNLMRQHLDEIDKHPDLKELIVSTPIKMQFHGENSIHPSIHEYEFKYPYVDTYILDKKYPQRWFLFHGSPKGNWYSILRNGIKNMSGTALMSNGAALGPGVYMTSHLSTAYGYGGNNISFRLGHSPNEQNEHCVAVVELLVNPDQYAKSPGIYVVPDDKMLFVKYMYRMKGLPKADAVPVLEYYKKLRLASIKDRTIVKRTKAELDSIKEFVIEELKDSVYLLAVRGNILRMYIKDYPFIRPIIQLAYHLEQPSFEFDNRGLFICDYTDWTPSGTMLQIIHNDLIPCLANRTQNTVEYKHLLE